MHLWDMWIAGDHANQWLTAALYSPGLILAEAASGPGGPADSNVWANVLAGVILGAVVSGAIGVVVVRRILAQRRREAEVAARSVAAFSPAYKAANPSAMAETQKIDAVSEVSRGTLDALGSGLEIHELERSALAEVVREAAAVSLDEIGEDILREKIARCVLGAGITKVLPDAADALWGCVLSWDPVRDDVEKQATDMLAWACEDAGNHPEARRVIEHSRHDIPVPDQMMLNRQTRLMFERNPNTLLDEGASAAVFRAHVPGSKDVAVKISRLVNHGILRNTLTEYLMLRRAQGVEGVIRMYGAGHYAVGDDEYFFIVEEMAQTTLADEFEARKAAGNLYSEKEVRDRLVRPILECLQALHERGIIHRDLKPKNIYRVDGAYKIGDFEIAGHSRDPSRTLHTGTFAGSPAYTTAGALVGRYGPETDINALACISYMMLRGDLPVIEDAPGTSTLVRGIRGGAMMTDDEKLGQEKAKKAVQEWLTQKRGFVTQIRLSLRSTPFERFFIAPIMAQGLYPEGTRGAIMTSADALRSLAQIDRAEEAQEMRRQALELAGKGDFSSARALLVDFDARFNRRSPEDIEVSMHVMIGDTLKAIEEMEAHPGPGVVLPCDNGERFSDGTAVDGSWRYWHAGRAVGRQTDSICRVSREGEGVLLVCPRLDEKASEQQARLNGRNPNELFGRFRLPDREAKRV